MATPKSMWGRRIAKFSTQGGGMNRENLGKYPTGTGRPFDAAKPLSPTKKKQLVERGRAWASPGTSGGPARYPDYNKEP